MSTATPILKETNKELRANASDLESRVEKLATQLADLSQAIAGYNGGTLGALAEDARRVKDDVTERSVAMANVAKERIVSAEGEVEQRIRENPLTAVGIAAGLGFLAAIMTRR
jgi:ElaB/YqjD/DUF883 family membrane-anchored ribosome-binding protein